MNTFNAKTFLGLTLSLMLLMSVAFNVETPVLNPPEAVECLNLAPSVPMPPKELQPALAWKCTVEVSTGRYTKIDMTLNTPSIVVVDWGDGFVKAYQPGTTLNYDYIRDYPVASGPGPFEIKFFVCNEHVSRIWAPFQANLQPTKSKLIGLDVVGLTQLTYLNAGWNEITGGLDLSTNTNLTMAFFNNNDNLGTLVLPAPNNNLEQLYFYSCGLSGQYDLSGFPSLRDISFGGNALTGIDINSLTKIEEIHLAPNLLTGVLDLSLNANLTNVHIEANDFESIIFPLSSPSTPNKLKAVHIHGNNLGQITPHSLDFRYSPELEFLNVSDNTIGTLQVDGLENLIRLYGVRSHISNTMNLIDCESLQVIDLRENPLLSDIILSDINATALIMKDLYHLRVNGTSHDPYDPTYGVMAHMAKFGSIYKTHPLPSSTFSGIDLDVSNTGHPVDMNMVNAVDANSRWSILAGTLTYQ